MERTIEGNAVINTKTVSFRLTGNNLQIKYNPDDAVFVTTAQFNSKGQPEFTPQDHIRVDTFCGVTKDSKTIAFKVSRSRVVFFEDLIDCKLDCYFMLDGGLFNSVSIISSDIHAITNDQNHPISATNNGITIGFKGNKQFYDANLSDGTAIKFACYETFKTMTKNKNPVEYIGQIQIVFDETDSIDRAFQLIELARSFVEYLTFRRDVILDEVFLGDYDETNSRFTKKRHVLSIE